MAIDKIAFLLSFYRDKKPCLKIFENQKINFLLIYIFKLTFYNFLF